MFRITADIQYLDGALTGLVIPAGYVVTMPDQRTATRTATWLKRVQSADDFIRAAGTGNRYKVVGRVCVERMGGR